MEVHIGHNKLVITTGPITFHFDLHIEISNNNRKHDIDSIIKHDEF